MNFTFQNLIAWLLFSFLTAQVIVWLFELRELGFRQWFRRSSSQSYVQYLASRSRVEWLRLVMVALAAFVARVGIFQIFS